MTKKSWHTANFNNQEKVWATEQKEKNEQNKLAALAKELKQEREMDELRKIQGKAGLAQYAHLFQTFSQFFTKATHTDITFNSVIILLSTLLGCTHSPTGCTDLWDEHA
jgi:CRISPR/Cas system-associated endonuclease Cas1